MVNFIKKKTKKINIKISAFVQKNIIRILVVLGVFITLELSKKFPYVNIIPSIDFLIIGLTLLLAVFLLRVSISNMSITLVVLFLFFIAMVMTIVELDDIAEMIGFIIFVLLSLMIVRRVFHERKDLKKIDLSKK